MKFLMLKALRTSGKKKLFIIPYLFTFSNALFGFLAIITALEGRYSTAACCIMAAGLMDIVDGRLARAFGCTSPLGMELDSLCDAISFCLAPTIVLYSWHLSVYGIYGIVSLMFYLCAGLFRLAKFNITSTVQSRSFVGLPTPIAAVLLATMVLHNYRGWHIVYLLMLLAFLMVSTIKFNSFKKSSVCSIKNSIACSVLSILSFVGVFVGYPILSLVIMSYIMCGVCITIYNRMKILT